MRSLKTNKVFVSAYRSEKTIEQNRNNHAYALNMLRREGISYRVIEGYWNGEQEVSILLQATSIQDHARNLEVALNLGRLFSQDAVLEVHNDDTASLHKIASGYIVESAGKLREATEYDAKARQAYSYDREFDRYFVVD